MLQTADAANGRCCQRLQATPDASGAADRAVKLWERPATSDIDLAQYVRSGWIRLVGSEMVWRANDNLLRDQSFHVANMRQTTVLGVELSGALSSKKFAEELPLFLHAGNCPGAIALWNARPAEAADLSMREELLASLSAFAADDLLRKITWRGIWLTEQIEAILSSEAMLNPAVSLGMLRLSTQRGGRAHHADRRPALERAT